MQLKNCTINIKAGQFTATTFIEMEFYNPNEQELEGLHQFELKPGQVITAFQLELNGKYRDGTLEEKWKATNAYNRIVGKRIDPALLTRDYNDHYSLRIYPVPARGTRRVTITIQQLLKVDKGSLQYALPLNVPDTVKNIRLSISCVGQDAVPASLPGIIEGQLFRFTGSQYGLQLSKENTLLKNAIRFSIPVLKRSIVCINKNSVGQSFALRFQPRADTIYNINAKKIIVFWDASASAESRDINKEIRFMQQFIAWHGVERITIIPFNYKQLDTATFNLSNSDNKWQQYLRNINYAGATQLGCINFKEPNPGLYLLFTDGKNTYGKRKPSTNDALVFCINSSTRPDLPAMNLIVGASGGKVIDLNKTTMASAIELSNKAENWLLNITSSSGKVITEQTLPLKIDQSIFINGTMPNAADTLIFHYGNSNAVSGEERIVLPVNESCSEPAIDRITMLQNFERVSNSYNWESILDFGLQENVVTNNTAFIVLERAEDYIKYNIEAPKDLQEECKLLQYVKSDTRKQRERIRQQDEFNIISNVVTIYNQRMKKMNADAVAINFDRKDLEEIQVNNSTAATTQPTGEANGSMAVRGLSSGTQHLDEVVVVGYGSSLRSNLTGAVSIVQTNELRTATTVEQALQGRVAGLVVTQNNTTPWAMANITLRGATSINGNNSPLFVLDGIPVTGNINELININDIQNITVLKDISSAAIYGSRAANGAIVITSKRSRPYYNNYSYKKYRLADMEDMEYIQEIQLVPASEKLTEYNRLAAIYGTTAGFYFDMAQHFFKCGLKKDAFEILMSAAETSNGNWQTQHAIGYVLEEWKMFDEAIQVYDQLLLDQPANMSLHRDLAWVYYQQGKYQQAVDILYNAIKANNGNDETVKATAKATMLYEMNEIITAHKDQLDLSKIPAALLKSLPMDLRIVIECNDRNISWMKVKEPGGELVSRDKVSKAGGLIDGNYNGWYYGNDAPMVYQSQQAVPGKYRVSVDYYGYYQHGETPSFIRIKTFKHFGKANESIEIENVIMDNQYGEIEIATVNFDTDKK